MPKTFFQIGIRHRITPVYGNKVMDESLVRRWVREFNKGRETVCDRKRCRPSLVTVERENVFATLSQTIDASNEPDYHLSCKT